MTNNLPINSKKKFKFSITFQSFDEESLDAGDSLDNGYEKEDDIDTIGDILYEANTTYGIYMPVSFGTWESTEPEEDKDFFEKGIRKYYALHITNEDGTEISQEESDFIAFLLSDGRYEINKFRDYAFGGIVLGAVALGVGALIIYFYFKGKKPKKAIANNRAKSVTHIINGRERTYPIKDAWRREHKLQNKSEKYEVPQEDRKPVNFEMGGDASEYYHEVEYGEGGVARAKDVIMNKIGYNEETADYFVSKSEKFAIWLADSILKEEIKNKNYNKKQWLDTNLSSYRVINANYGGGIRTILDWLQHPVTPKQDLRKLSFDEAVEKAQDWHNELQVLGGDIDFIEPESNVIIKRYPKTDEGIEYYWIYIPSNYCDLESSRMGHCGRTGYGNKLISLRSVKPFGKGHTISDSHVTIAYGVNDGIFYQIKGKKNNKPSEKYFSYVFDLIKSILNDEINERFRKENEESIKVVEYLIDEQKKIKQEILPLLTFPYLSSASSTEIRFLEGNLSLDESIRYLRQDSPIYDNSATIYKLKRKLNEVRSNRDYDEINNERERLREETYTYLKENIFDKYKEHIRLGSLKKESEKDLMDFEFNGFGSEYGADEDYGWEDMTKQEITELYELNPNLFNDFAGKYMLYEAGLSVERPNTTILIEKSPEYVTDLLQLDRDLSDEVVEKVLTGETYDLFSGSDYSYYFENAGDYVDNLNKENYEQVIDKIVELTGLEKSVVKENGAKHYLEGDDEEFDSDTFDDIKRSISSAMSSAVENAYVKYYYKKIKSALSELGTIKKLDYDGVFIQIDLENLIGISAISSYLKELETESLEDVFFEAESQGEIELPELSIDDRYSAYPEDEDFNANFDIDMYEKGGSLRPKTINTNKKTKIKNMKPSQRKLAKGGNIETGISREDYFLVVKNWVYFTFNYPMGFVKDAFNSKHLEEKFSSSYERYSSKAVLPNFWANLDLNNREILSMWIKNNYFSSSDDKSKLLTISDDDYAQIISNWNMFCFNYPYQFVEKVFADNFAGHFVKKFTRSYEIAGSSGAVNNFFTELDGGNQMLLTDWVYDNYKEMTFAGGGGVGENEIDFQNFTIDEFMLFVKSISAYGDIQVSVSVGNNIMKEGTYTKKIESKKIKDLSMSIGYTKEISVYKGSETIYADVLVYDNNYDNGYKEYTISLFSKDDQTGLKSVVNSIIEKFKNGGRVTTNDGIIEAFLTSERELKVGNLSTHFNGYDNQILLRNYGTLIATRKGNDVEITNTKFSKTTTTITNKVKSMALNSRMNVKHVDKFAEGGRFANGGGISEAREFNYRSNFLYVTEVANGLKLELTDEGINGYNEEEINDMYDLFEDIQANSEMAYIDNAGDMGFGLTEAPIVTDGYYYDDNGDFTDEGVLDSKVYVWNDYMLKDLFATLMEQGSVVLTEVKSYAEGGEIKLRVKNVDSFDKHYDEVGFTKKELSLPKQDSNKNWFTTTNDKGIAQQLISDGFVEKFAEGGSLGHIGKPYSFDVIATKKSGDKIKELRVAYAGNKEIAKENLLDFLKNKLHYTEIKIIGGREGHEKRSRMAKGGLIEHGLREGDSIIEEFGDDDIGVKSSKGDFHRINLDLGIRMKKGGSVGQMNNAKHYWKSSNKKQKIDFLVGAGYSKSVANDLSNEDWDGLEIGVHKNLLAVLMAEGGEADGKIKIRGFAPINKEIAILMNEDFEQNFRSNLEKYTKHLNKVHNSKLRLIDVKEVIDFANKYAEGGSIDEKYKVVKVFRKSGRREILEKNLTIEEAKKVVSRYPNSNTSMVVFMKMFSEGGEAGELINVSGNAFYITDTSVENADKNFDSLSDTFFSSKDDFENNMDAIQEFSFNVNVKYQYNIITAIYEQMAEEGVGNDEGNIQVLGFEVDRYPKNDFESELPYDIQDEDEEDDDDDEYAEGGGAGSFSYDYYEVYDELTGKSLMIYAIDQEDAESIAEELDFESFEDGDEYNPNEDEYAGGGELLTHQSFFIVDKNGVPLGYKEGYILAFNTDNLLRHQEDWEGETSDFDVVSEKLLLDNNHNFDDVFGTIYYDATKGENIVFGEELKEPYRSFYLKQINKNSFAEGGEIVDTLYKNLVEYVKEQKNKKHEKYFLATIKMYFKQDRDWKSYPMENENIELNDFIDYAKEMDNSEHFKYIEDTINKFKIKYEYTEEDLYAEGGEAGITNIRKINNEYYETENGNAISLMEEEDGTKGYWFIDTNFDFQGKTRNLKSQAKQDFKNYIAKNYTIVNKFPTEKKSLYAKGGSVKGIKKKAEKLLEESINYRFKNTDMGSGWLFQLESPLNRGVFNLLEEQLYLDEFSPDDMGIEDYDDLSKEEQDYYYEDWKEELFQSTFEAFKEKCKKHLDDFIEYIQQAKEYQDEMNEYAEGGSVKKTKLQQASEYWKELEGQMSEKQKKFYNELLKRRQPSYEKNFNDKEIAEYINGEIIEQFGVDLGITNYQITGVNGFKLGFKFIAYRESVEEPEFYDEMNEYAKGGETKENWNNASYDEKLKWLKTRTELYPEKGDIFDMADIYARTQYHLLPNNVHRAIIESQKFADGGEAGYSKKDRVIDYYYNNDVFDDYETYGLSEDDLNNQDKVVKSIIKYHGLNKPENVEERFETLGLEDFEEEFAEGGEVQDWMEQALDSLIKETGNEDLDITMVSDNGNEFFAGNDIEEYRVFKTEDDAEEKAIEQVSDDMQESPENFNFEFLMNNVYANDFLTEELKKMNYSYAKDITSESDKKYANRLIAEMVENGLLDEDDALSDDGEELAEERIEDLVNLMTEEQLDGGSIDFDYFINNYGEEETIKMFIENNVIDINEASKDAVETDGIAHFLSSYDGETLYLSDDCVAYRVN